MTENSYVLTVFIVSCIQYIFLFTIKCVCGVSTISSFRAVKCTKNRRRHCNLLIHLNKISCPNLVTSTEFWSLDRAKCPSRWRVIYNKMKKTLFEYSSACVVMYEIISYIFGAFFGIKYVKDNSGLWEWTWQEDGQIRILGKPKVHYHV
jgi:hypothetical protein